MKRNILTLMIVSIFAITISFGFVGCKKEAPVDQPNVEEKADDKAPAEKDAAKEEVKKEEAAGK